MQKIPPPLLYLREYCGITHERQVLRIPLPAGPEALLWGRVAETGKTVPVQRSREDPLSGFVEVELRPFDTITLECCNGGEIDGCAVSYRDGVAANGLLSLELPVGSIPGANGPVRRMRVGGGPWRGGTFLDSRRAVKGSRGELLENGPVRLVYRFRAEFEPEGFYEAKITVDRGQALAVIEENFQADAGAQVVWDFSGKDLPEEFYLLDSSAHYQTRPLFYYFDQRLTRLACWTQQSQHFEFSDGYAVRFAGNEIAGFIALEGGSWRGGKLNQLEAWTRRWLPGDRSSRRDVPSEAKADAQPGPERIPARGEAICEAHFNIEGWIGQGRRKWALALTTLEKIAPADTSGEPLGAYEAKLTRDRYGRQQSWLRRVQIQRGILPFHEMAGLDFEWPEEAAVSTFAYPNDVLRRHLPASQDIAAARESMMDYLAARVYGYWEGSGAAYTNPVSSRRVAPEMYRYEWLAAQGALSAQDRRLARAQFAFLMHLFASENFHAGDASMLPVESPDSLDPTLAGMANQNFYTDVINIPGAGAQIFHQHPRAEHWRTLFIERWHRQLAYHMYPESGVWEESHTYYHHVLHTVLPTLLRRRADGVDDEFANPGFQKLAGAELRQITPRDAFFHASRHVVIFGDHHVEVELYRYLWRELSEVILPHNLGLAEQLAWLYSEMLGKRPLPVIARAPRLRNEYVQGLGVMFRGIDGAGEESLLALRSGSAWGHHHNDDGSIQFYAKGRAQIVDAAFGMVQESRKKVEAIGHSRWTLKNLEPVNYLWRFNRGWIAEAALDGPLAYATAWSPVLFSRAPGSPGVPLRTPVRHYRTVVQITPAAYLVVDVADPVEDQLVIFHRPAQVNIPSHLHVTPLFSRPDERIETDRPRDIAADIYSTLAMEYSMGRVPMSAFLVTAGENPPEVRESGAWNLRGEDFELSVVREGERRLVIQSAGTERSFAWPAI